MAKAGFSVYEFTVTGLRLTLDNVRLLALSMLTFFGGMLAALLGAALIVSPTIFKFWGPLASLKQLMTNVALLDKAAQAKAMKEFWQQIAPTFTTLDTVLAVISGIFFFVVLFGLVLGFLKMALEVVDRGDSAVSRVISCFHLAPRFFVASLISMILVALGFICFIIPGIILTLRLRFFPYYIIDKNMGAIASLKASFHATKGYGWEILGLNVVAAVLAMIMPIIGIPVSCFMLAAAYRALLRQ